MRLVLRPHFSCLALLLLSPGVACKGDDTEEPVDTELPEDSAEPEAFFRDIAVSMSALIPSVATVTWETRDPAICTVEWGNGYTMTADRSPSQSHQAQLVGHLPGSEVSLRISAETESGIEHSEEQRFIAGFLPSASPAVNLDTRVPESSMGGFTLVPIFTHEATWVSVVNDAGAVVWTIEALKGCHRVRLAPDGGGVLFNEHDAVPELGEDEWTGSLYSVAWDGTRRWVVRDTRLHHDFVILGEDRYASLGYALHDVDVGTEDERTLLTDTILEFDSAGEVELVWDSIIDIDPAIAPTNASSTMGDDGPWDWSHGNYLTTHDEAGDYLLVLRNLDAIVAVDIETHELSWALSNVWGDYAHGGEVPLEWPHSVEITDEGLWVFNQTYESNGDACSHAAIFQLDDDAGTVSRSWFHENEECSKVNYLGSVHPLENDNRLVVWSQDGLLDEVTPEGEIVHRISTELDWSFAYAERVSSLYPP